MRSLFNDLLAGARFNLTIATSALGVVAVTLGAYFHQQVRRAVTWVLAPITEQLPWNRKKSSSVPPKTTRPELIAQLSIVDVSLLSLDGKKAKYQKKSTYIVMKDGVHTYKEGVTSAGSATSFSTSRGVIIATTKEHGFFVSTIDLGNLYSKGSQFTNVYSAELHDCFTSRSEHWTQEIAIPTNHLVIQVHFPKGRAPLLVKCKVLEGMIDKQIKTAAEVLELAGEKSIVWKLDGPQIKKVYKLEWVW